jgi:hypothetical protein
MAFRCVSVMHVFVNISLVFLGFYAVLCDVTWSSGACLVPAFAGRVATCARVGSGASRSGRALCDLYPSWVRCLASASGPLRLASELGQVPSVRVRPFATCARVGPSA